MSAADRMVIRTRDGYRSVPRRVGLGMISRGQAQAAPAGAPAVSSAPADAAGVDPLGPHGDEYQATTNPYPPEMFEETGEVDTPYEIGPDQIDLSADDPISTWTDDPADPELEERRRALGLKYDAEFKAVRGSVEYHPEALAAGLPPEPRGNAARKEWAAYASEHLGIEVTDAMNRNQIRDAAQEQLQSLARLPQPALPGGRLETPEDEPVTEGSVTDDEDPGTR
jgi:hypothetical protein